MSVVDIHSLGLGEVKRIRGEMQAVINQLRYQETINLTWLNRSDYLS
ncbi:hypothetical protein C427_5389 [Paraglaciecola psychrophila 170]|uniref:Uncharacterized protein n=3 Tax=Paraglaciecola TaxID=1621534 RepID=M4RVB1_9ALTE|nr:hypothetical protein C427_5389 [Paraglaciecola psychrophila 170]